ncbi:hypothetical protein HHI36_016604 [Cryptolaemus montrouzieri]|uniref:Uncharacterized protein n=1 Tax=Cryptolaemus montrouzieri TaxID=559131 RepID=A0ABD2NK95_9CUCU
MKSFIEFENTSLEKFLQHSSKIEDDVEKKSKVQLAEIYNLRGVFSEKQTSDHENNMKNMNELSSATKYMTSVLSQIEFFMVLGTFALSCFCALKIYGKKSFIRSREEISVHEMPILQ